MVPSFGFNVSPDISVKVFFWMRLNLQPVDFEKSRFSSCTSGRFQPTVEGLMRECTCSLVQSSPTLNGPRTVIHQSPLSMGFPELKNTGVGRHFPSLGTQPNPGSKTTFLESPALAEQILYH